MRIALVWCPRTRSRPDAGPELPEQARALARGFESMGHQTDIIDAWNDDGLRLPGYSYIAVLAEQASLFGGVMPEALPRILGAGRGLGGKKSAAFLKKIGPFTDRALAGLMRAMEREGMIVNWSDVILSAPHAEALAKRIGS